MKLVIDRSKWLRGEGSTSSYLLRKNDGKMCCLGMLAEQCGIPTKSLVNIKGPQVLAPSFKKMFSPGILLKNDLENHIVTAATLACADLMEVNDSPNLSKFDRENRLKILFNNINIDVEFIN